MRGIEEKKKNGREKKIAKTVPKIAISIVSIIENINSDRLEKSGGVILSIISTKYLGPSTNKLE